MMKVGFKQIIASGALILLVSTASLGQKARVHRIVIELTSDNPEQWEATLNNVENLQKALGNGQTQIEVVAHGKGLEALRKTDTSAAERIATIAGTGVRFAACQNTMRKKHLTKEDLLPVVQPVDSGVSEVVRKQEAGWAYLKSGS